MSDLICNGAAVKNRKVPYKLSQHLAWHTMFHVYRQRGICVAGDQEVGIDWGNEYVCPSLSRYPTVLYTKWPGELSIHHMRAHTEVLTTFSGKCQPDSNIRRGWVFLV